MIENLSEKQICRDFVRQATYLIGMNQIPKIKHFKQVFHVGNEQRQAVGGLGGKIAQIKFWNHLRSMGCYEGFPDYLVVYQEGKVAFIEFKKSKNLKLSPNQLIYKEIFEAAGCKWLTTHNIETAIEFLKNL